MHQEEAASLVIPEFSGTHAEGTQTYYWGKNAFKDNSEWVGTISLYLAIIGLFFYRHRKEAWFFAGLFLFALLYGLGGTTPFPSDVHVGAEGGVDAERVGDRSSAHSRLRFSPRWGAEPDRLARRREEAGRQIQLLVRVPSLLLLLAICFSVAGKGC
jgi:hypothetical protein